jgi:hypothetical protein
MIVIDRRFNGPPHSAHGGYACGMFAAAVDAGRPVVVNLHAPPPLDVPLTVEPGVRRALVWDGDDLVAVVSPVSSLPAPVSCPDLADLAPQTFEGHTAHPFPTCFVCGTGRPDGLGLAPAPIGPGLVAAAWTPLEPVRQELVWATLDCPSGWTAPMAGRARLLTRMVADVRAQPRPGRICVSVARLEDQRGRILSATSSLWDAGSGALLGVAATTWTNGDAT